MEKFIYDRTYMIELEVREINKIITENQKNGKIEEAMLWAKVVKNLSNEYYEMHPTRIGVTQARQGRQDDAIKIFNKEYFKDYPQDLEAKNNFDFKMNRGKMIENDALKIKQFIDNAKNNGEENEAESWKKVLTKLKNEYFDMFPSRLGKRNAKQGRQEKALRTIQDYTK